jgi:hypothetical protein
MLPLPCDRWIFLAFDPLMQLRLTQAPLTTDLKSRKIGSPDHPMQRSRGYLQTLGGFSERQQSYVPLRFVHKEILGRPLTQ